jgi:demethylmenaquinone methyltransferase / 2-methoxy-6-polyprenyl-1,4-benzoquinol methylase
VSTRNPHTAEEQRAAIERMFSAIVPRYDLLNRLLSAGRDRAWRRAAIRAARLVPAGWLLDICTGTADMPLEAARQSSAIRIAGVDFSAPMIAAGRAKVARADLRARIALQVAVAEALPFADGAFDAVTVAFGLRNLPDRRQGLREMLRVLRPGGRAVILEFTTPPSPIVLGLYRWYSRRVLSPLGRLVSGHRFAYEYLPASVADFPPPAGVTAWMEEVGFENVSYHLMTCGIVAIHVGAKRSD